MLFLVKCREVSFPLPILSPHFLEFLLSSETYISPLRTHQSRSYKEPLVEGERDSLKFQMDKRFHQYVRSTQT